ncbi:hypothetical protein LAZ67_X000879 [Cordylochernes scorpioides]|uniref:Tc1-like transposase DDE domain-containing protein n=1 Tax=Cordylochernes scorpioides TaxID=51811 RepID=A0ABY6LT25_9ARAC|nr:hypothetical protein LAZ67_X000879 [Cordylochernes scorpioides]
MPIFNLGVHSGRIHVRCRPQGRSHLYSIVENHTASTNGFIVWRGIIYGSRTPLVFIQGTMTAQLYITDVLQPVVLLFLEQTNNALFLQVNARLHTANISRTFLQNVDILPLLTCFTDLSPIERVWDLMGRKIWQAPQPNNLQKLRQKKLNPTRSPKKTTV